MLIIFKLKRFILDKFIILYNIQANINSFILVEFKKKKELA